MSPKNAAIATPRIVSETRSKKREPAVSGSR
jgi:hypothetical protein